MLVLMCRAGEHRFALDASVVAEVVPYVTLRTIPNSPDWLAGVFAYRGRVLSVIDLVQTTAGTPSEQRWSSRIVIVNWPDDSGRMLGVLVEQVTTTQLNESNRLRQNAESSDHVPENGAVRLDDAGMFHVLDIKGLLNAERQAVLQAVAG